MKKTIKIYNEENVNVNITFDKVVNVDFYGTDAAFDVVVTDKETGTVLEKHNMTIKNVFNGVDTCEDVEYFFEDKNLDGDEYDWEIPEEMLDEFNEYLNERYSEMYYDWSDEEMNEILEPHMKDIYEALEFNDYIYYIDNKTVEFIDILVDSYNQYFINAEGVTRVYDMNTESMIYKYKGVYFSFSGHFNIYSGVHIYLELLRRNNHKKKVTAEMVDNYGIPCLTSELIGQYVYEYEEAI